MNLINRAKNMILSPKTEWGVISAEMPNVNQILTGYVAPFVILGAIAAFIGYGLIGFGVLGVHFFGVSWGIYHALVKLIVGIASIFLVAFVVDALAPSFGSEKNFGRSVQLVAYGGTPALIAALFAILPLLAGILGLAGAIYSVYIWYLGLGPVKGTPEDKKVVYLIVIFAVLMVAYFVITMILAAILLPVFGLSYGIYNL